MVKENKIRRADISEKLKDFSALVFNTEDVGEIPTLNLVFWSLR